MEIKILNCWQPEQAVLLAFVTLSIGLRFLNIFKVLYQNVILKKVNHKSFLIHPLIAFNMVNTVYQLWRHPVGKLIELELRHKNK